MDRGESSLITISVDTASLVRGTRQITIGLRIAATTVPLEQAKRTSGKIAENTPVLTGRLRKTVRPVKVPGGAGVTYGGTLPYARKIERHDHMVREGIKGTDREFQHAMIAAAELVTGRL